MNREKEMEKENKKLKNENERLKNRITILETSLSETNKLFNDTVEEFNDAISSLRIIKSKYKELINITYKKNKKYSDEINKLICNLGGTDMND